MTRINGRQKGARGEREAAAFAREHWGAVKARRGAQNGVSGGRDVEDVLPGVRVEVKREERLNVARAYRQAVEDAAREGGVPVVMHRPNRKPWRLTFNARDAVRIAGAFAAIEGRTVYPGHGEALVTIEAADLEAFAGGIAAMLGRPIYPGGESVGDELRRIGSGDE